MSNNKIGEALRLCVVELGWLIQQLEADGKNCDGSVRPAYEAGRAALAATGAAVGGMICKSHGLAVLTTHVNDGEPCTDYLLGEKE